MVTKSRLKMALAAEKGTDFKKLNQKKKAKEAAKRKAEKEAAAAEEEESEDSEMHDEEDEEDADSEDQEDNNGVYLEGIDDSDTSESEVEMEKPLPRKPTKKPPTKSSAPAEKDDEDEDDEEEEEEEEDEEDIPVSDLEDLDDEDKEDLIPHTRLTINNKSALLASLARIALPTDPKAAPFATHQSVSSAAETAASIPDVSDDLQRELAFYAQGLEAVRAARTKLKAEGVPFSRPKDYFAEMVKEDAHMEKIRAKLVEEASNKKAAAEARKLRDLKKFGKQVQVAKLQERQKAKRETLEKIKTLKRKRQESGNDMSTHEADLFDVGVDQELSKPNRRGDNRSGAGRGAMKGGANHKRQKKDEKFGFGGKKKHSKSGDAMSSSDLSGFNAKKMKAGGRVSKPTRPGKNRRKAMSGR